ncbi:MAG: hypothetical protein GY679_03315 [Mycoplasma sp.]|nr:hypothetical protein [Mycoplasma sp.]
MKNIFISFHHRNNQKHYEKISKIVKGIGYRDISVNEGTKVDDEEHKTDEQIRREIRDNFLKDLDVTIVIVGSDTKNRKHVDWEIYGSVYDFQDGKSGGIVVIDATEGITNGWILNPELIREHDSMPAPGDRSWPDEITDLDFLPERLLNSIKNKYSKEDSLKGQHKHAVFPIVKYNKVIENPKVLKLAIEQSIQYIEKNKGKWDYSKLRRKNNESPTRKIYGQVDA